MNSPIIILIIWFVINLLIKSANDKKKIEAARRKRDFELKDNRSARPSFQDEIKRTVSTLKEEIQREIQKEKEKSLSVPSPRTSTKAVSKTAPKKDNVYRSNLECGQLQRDDWDIQRDVPEVTTTTVTDEKKERTSSPIDIQNDILRGIIFSEILSEPKSIKNIQRGI